MTPEQFPILFASLNKLQAYGRRYSQPATEAEHEAVRVRATNRTAAAIAVVTQAIADDAIANRDFQDAKSDLNRAFEDAFRVIKDTPEYYAIVRREVPADDALVSALYDLDRPECHTVDGRIKKAAKMPSHPIIDAVRAFYAEIKPLADAVQYFAKNKDKIVKRQIKSEEERRIERYTPPPATTEGALRTKALLEKIVAESYEGLLDAYLRQYTAFVDTFLKRQAKAVADPEVTSIYKWQRAYFADHAYLTSLVLRCCDHENGRMDTPLVRRADADETIAAEAKRDADDVRDSFVAKNLRKLVSILEAKGDDQFLSVEETGRKISVGAFEGSLIFKFKDGSQFEACNSVVWSYSVLGKRFCRYPLTFHSVKLPGGVKMPGPSEKRMNTVFVGKPE